MNSPETKILDFLTRFSAQIQRRQRDDIHIEQIDEAFRDRSRWVRGARSTFTEAVRIRDINELLVTVSMQFFLKPIPKRRRIALKRLEDLSDQLSHVPPALTLYAVGAEPWLHGAAAFESLASIVAGSEIESSRALYQEWLDEDDEYDRRVWLVSDATPDIPS